MTDASPSLNILAQYIKDLSFENPGAPRSLQSRDQAPAININVNVNANPLSDTDFDVVLTLIKDAGHRLSRPEDLAKILSAVEAMS